MQYRAILLLALCTNDFPAEGPAPNGGPDDSEPNTSGIVFTDASAAAGIHDFGLSFGAAAGDANGDGWVDLFTGGHYTSHPHLWINQQNGTFAEGIATMVPPPSGDLHGAQWTDLDADGQQELVLLRGANYGLTPTPKFVYRRFGAQLTDIATYIGLDVPLMRARTPLAGDFDGDGRLDVFITALQRTDGLAPPGPYKRQAGPTYAANWPATPFALGSDSLFGVLGDLDGDHRIDMLLHASPLRAMSFNATGLTNITAGLGLPPVTTMYDAIVADLTGDGENEIYIARSPNLTSMQCEKNHQLEFRAIVVGQEHGVRFAIAGPHTMTLEWGPTTTWPLASVHIGANDFHPTSNGVTLDPANPAHAGVAPHPAGQCSGIYVGWDPAANEWSIAVSATIWNEALLRITTNAPMGPPTAFGWNASPTSPSDLLLERVSGTYVDRTTAAGIPAWLRGRSVVAADFDNDMDLDLYVVTSTSSANTPNVLLENNGHGQFQVVNARDAVGSSAGIGDTAITLDYDRDGDVDLFVLNGDCSAFRPTGGSSAFGDDGPAQLLRNDTNNSNHWLDVALVGMGLNREGIGARVEVTAGGITQVREQGGGMHRYSQNHGLHFGLGPNATASLVKVTWPNGSQSLVNGVLANRQVTVRQ